MAFNGFPLILSGRSNRSPRPGLISLHKGFAARPPPTAKKMERLGNNYFLLSLISKKGTHMEDGGTAEDASSHSCYEQLLLRSSRP